MITKKIAMVLGALALTGCKLETQSTIYLADIQDVAGGKAAKTQATLSLPMPSDEKCKEYAPAVIEALTPSLGEIRQPQCRKDGFDNKLDLIFDMAILKLEENREKWPIIAVSIKEADKKFAIYLTVNPTKIKAAQSAVSDKLRGAPKADLNEMKIIMTISNDLREKTKVMVGSVFADGAPIPYGHKIDIERRAEIKLVLSNVATASLLKHGIIGFSELDKPE
jgi:hypothetical protein